MKSKKKRFRPQKRRSSFADQIKELPLQDRPAARANARAFVDAFVTDLEPKFLPPGGIKAQWGFKGWREFLINAWDLGVVDLIQDTRTGVRTILVFDRDTGEFKPATKTTLLTDKRFGPPKLLPLEKEQGIRFATHQRYLTQELKRHNQRKQA